VKKLSVAYTTAHRQQHTKRNRADRNSTQLTGIHASWLEIHHSRRARALRSASGMTALGELILVTSSVAVSLGLSRLALGELFRLVRITGDRQPHDGPRQ